ncbi:chemotaxis protein CheW [Pseudoalteromonas sp. H71]|uniref:chemotaxis protein CheW n=1 Tax=Pseudoalteromonas sp. H71 TaxID=1348395 RepID=UPI00072FD703|nr:chemotaxis protein CheW [Pseudoalteromonas sp. H71]KTD98858.1 chemotaxis protein CheW [Pseudoalteromonas sp. H71]|tara:strand:- start:27 stop:821 length:795 start_codon:yes stop_codon:yes gene_type:complete
MSKQLFANEKVMTQYLGALLCEEELASDLEPVAKLLENIPDDSHNVTADLRLKKPDVEVKTELSTQLPVVKNKQDVTETKTVGEENIDSPKEVTSTSVDLAEEAKPKLSNNSESDYFDGEFQALFFEVAGLTLAVPLKALGGIHQLGEVNHLFGKPKWFKGVMLNRDEKLNVVDTARWVMPEKYDEKLEASLDYQYLITLGDSQWGLLAEKLINNITLTKEDVKWRTDQSKRPWLAGVIKEKMCALIDVDNLNTLLEEGLDSRQ